ncbi:hypothetical protein, partial [Klebsiella pneumoniae]|uniref:hypothetical protein n=1 Tax=Klebsiella pneumoniae TaxID=573 RepID=UPI0028F6E36A
LGQLSGNLISPLVSLGPTLFKLTPKYKCGFSVSFSLHLRTTIHTSVVSHPSKARNAIVIYNLEQEHVDRQHK